MYVKWFYVRVSPMWWLLGVPCTIKFRFTTQVHYFAREREGNLRVRWHDVNAESKQSIWLWCRRSRRVARVTKLSNSENTYRSSDTNNKRARRCCDDEIVARRWTLLKLWRLSSFDSSKKPLIVSSLATWRKACQTTRDASFISRKFQQLSGHSSLAPASSLEFASSF